jgi:hypothetical protein
MNETASPRADAPTVDDLQFERAQFTDGTTSALTCAACQQPLTSAYFEVNAQPACPECRVKTEQALGGSAGMTGVAKAIGAGLAAGVVGALVYYAVVALTGYEFGLIAILVGFMVGYAVRWGSGGRGGARYQAIAIALTYLSIVGSYAPFLIQSLRDAPAQQATESGAQSTTPVAVTTETSPTAASSPDGTTITASQALMGLAMLFALLLASPLLGGLQNILGILIIGLGLYEAWKLNKRTVLQIAGPFQIGRPAAATAPAP